MSDFQDRVSDYPDRRSPAAHGEQAGAHGPGGGGIGGSVHQVVFRWDGNQGRQGTGMKAVAHSCPAERAEELGRELGPLLWVSGTAASRQSVVRTLSRDGDVMLVQRWPTTDRGGRPSTISHVLIGDPGTLKIRQCLGLSYGGWGSRESAEKASGRLRVIECAQLDALARKRLPAMLELLPAVKHALILVAAEWLRDPAQRVSLLADEKGQPGWPDQDSVPVAYLGLFLLFGRWLGQEWTFATHDTVDTHQLRLTCVPHWEPDAGGAGPLARVTGRRVTPRFEHKAAARLVDHLLDRLRAHPDAAAGVPQLVDELAGGAGLEWARRRVLLHEILSTDRRTGTRADAPAPAPRSAEPGPVGEGDEGGEDRERAETTPPQRLPKPYPYPDPHLDPRPDVYSDPRPDVYSDPYPDTYAPPAPEDSPPWPLRARCGRRSRRRSGLPPSRRTGCTRTSLTIGAGTPCNAVSWRRVCAPCPTSCSWASCAPPTCRRSPWNSCSTSWGTSTASRSADRRCGTTCVRRCSTTACTSRRTDRARNPCPGRPWSPGPPTSSRGPSPRWPGKSAICAICASCSTA
ncbi:hypothetical protein [Streptomyces mirabilis]|uniref:hypothetical protein n=1 Tax=Streptomyces mirabilis TaxID=68239 RepID=UPI0031BA9773